MVRVDRIKTIIHVYIYIYLIMKFMYIFIFFSKEMKAPVLGS